MIKQLATYSPQLLAIEEASHEMPWSEATLRSCFQSDYRVYAFFDEQSATMQGFYIAHQVCDELTLMNIAVHPVAQGQGLGRKLLQHLLNDANSNDLTIWLEVRSSNHIAQELYAATGFKRVGCRPDYYPSAQGREDAIVMRWNTT